MTQHGVTHAASRRARAYLICSQGLVKLASHLEKIVRISATDSPEVERGPRMQTQVDERDAQIEVLLCERVASAEEMEREAIAACE